MPERLKSAPATLLRFMQRVFNDNPSPDDVCSISQTFEEHLTNLREMFDSLWRHDSKINASKSIFGASRITLLGHEIARNPAKKANNCKV